MEIREDDPRREGVSDLLREHLSDVRGASPPGHAHALGIEALAAPAVTFWTAWVDDALVGCGALLELDDRHGEIKSMRAATPHRRRGVGSFILDHIVAEARSRGYTRLSLETGAQDHFAPARTFYERHGFDYGEPFADYRADPASVFMSRALDDA